MRIIQQEGWEASFSIARKTNLAAKPSQMVAPLGSQEGAAEVTSVLADRARSGGAEPIKGGPQCADLER